MRSKSVLPAWSKEWPKAAGLYLHAEAFGSINFITVRENDMERDGRMGRTLIDPRFAPHWWCGPVTADNLFTDEMRADFKAAWDDLPRRKLEEAETVVRQNPRSRKAKERLEEVKREIASAT